MKHRNELAEQAAILLATSFVVVAGTALCGFIITAFADSWKKPVVVCAVVAATVSFLLWLLNSKPRRKSLETNLLWLIRRKQRDEVPVYYPRKREQDPVYRDFGTNRPPSADSVKQIKTESTTTWVPSQQSSGRPKRGQ